MPSTNVTINSERGQTHHGTSGVGGGATVASGDANTRAPPVISNKMNIVNETAFGNPGIFNIIISPSLSCRNDINKRLILMLQNEALPL
jgi:hypothetical protein